MDFAKIFSMAQMGGRALAIGERNDNNRNHPGSRDAKHETWAETNKKAAQNTIALLIIIFLATFLFKLLIFLGRLSLKLFGPKWGWIVNIVGLVLLIGIPVCTMNVSEARREAAAAEAAEQAQLEQEQREKQMNAEIEAYRSEVREKVNSLEDRCKAEELPFEEVVQVYEKNSKITWHSGMTDSFARGEIDRAFKSCEGVIDKHYSDKIRKVGDYINKKVAELESKITADDYVHVAQFKNKMGDKQRGGDYVLNYKVPYDKITKQIDAEYQICVNDIIAKANSKSKIDQYIKDREAALAQLAKQDIQHRGDYYVEMFKRRMIHKSIGGIVDFDAPFDSVKQKIDEAYLEAERKINAASER